MSQVTDYTDQVNAKLDGISDHLDGIVQDVTGLKADIEALKNSPTLSDADKAALQGIVDKVSAVGDKAAAADAAEQDKLAKVLQNVTGATDDVVAANEQFISGLQRTTTFSDSEMRPALAALVAATGDLAEAQGMLRLAQDISIGTGLSLVDVSSALAKASNDNFK